MASTYIAIFLFLAAVLIAVVFGWWWAKRVKSDLAQSPTDAAGRRAELEMTAGNAQALRALSADPILLKQSEDGVRVQIEQRPMLPLMAFVGTDVNVALNEAVALTSKKWGSRWVVLLSVREDGAVTAQRLS